MEFLDTLTTIQNLAVWGAVTGTIGTVTGVLSLWLRFRHQKRDQARLKCEAEFKFEVSNGVPRPRYKIVVRCVGRRPVSLDCIEYLYNPESKMDRLLRYWHWRKGQWCSKEQMSRTDVKHLSEGQKAEFPIKTRRLEHLHKVARVRVHDETGRTWPVKWPNSRLLSNLTRHGEIDRIEEENARRNCKIVGYYLRGDMCIFAQWNKEAPNKNLQMGRTFYFKSRDAYDTKMQQLRTDQIPKLLNEDIQEIT